MIYEAYIMSALVAINPRIATALTIQITYVDYTPTKANGNTIQIKMKIHQSQDRNRINNSVYLCRNVIQMQIKI